MTSTASPSPAVARTEHFGVTGVPAAALVRDGRVFWCGQSAQVTEEMRRAWTE